MNVCSSILSPDSFLPSNYSRTEFALKPYQQTNIKGTLIG